MRLPSTEAIRDLLDWIDRVPVQEIERLLAWVGTNEALKGPETITDMASNRGWLALIDKPRPARVMAYVAFGVGIDYDADGAAAELEQAGYVVHRLPEKYRRLLRIPGDDHMEAVIADRDADDVFDEVGAIAERCGGDCIECGPIGPEYEPFVELFGTGG
jgi:hypothetical protein